MNKKLTRCLLALLVSLVWALPALAEKQALDDGALDGVTAGGDSAVLIASGPDGTADYTDTSIFSLAMPTGAQHGLRALTIQNVVGEVQLLVNLNVLSAQGNVAATDQRNFGVQSWGSTLPVMAAVVDGQPGAPGGPGGDVSHNTVNVDPVCIGLGSCNPQVTMNAGNGGNASSPVPGTVQIGNASGDVIVQGTKSATVTNDPIYSLAMDTNAQTDIGALFIANIVGRAQTAFNINIAAAQLNLLPADGTAFAQPLASTGPGVIKQINSGVQFRGTPLGFSPNANLNVQVTQTPN